MADELEPLQISQSPIMPPVPDKPPVSGGPAIESPDSLTTTGYTTDVVPVPTPITSATHNIVQTPDNARVAFPKGTPTETMHAALSKRWTQLVQSSIKVLGGSDLPANIMRAVSAEQTPAGHAAAVANRTAPIINAVGQVVNAIPGAGTALEAGEKYYVEPMEKWTQAVRKAAIASVQSPFATMSPKTQNYLRSQGIKPEGPMPPWMQGINEESIGFAAQMVSDPRMYPFFAESLATEAAPGVARAVLGRALSGVVATQMGAGATSQVQNLIDNWDTMSVKERSAALTGTTLDTVMAGLSGYHAAVGSPVAPTPETKAAATPYEGAERRVSDRTLMSPTEINAAIEARQLQGIRTPFDVTEGANETIARDVNMPQMPHAEQPVTVGTPEGAARDTQLFAQARTELGPDASVSDVAKRAQELKAAPKADANELQLRAHEANGGSTFTPDGKNLIGEDKYAVGAYPERTEQVDNLTPERLQAFKDKKDRKSVV